MGMEMSLDAFIATRWHWGGWSPIFHTVEMWWTYGWMPLLQQGGSGIKPLNDLFYYYK